jgi:pilus assembly protein FimV
VEPVVNNETALSSEPESEELTEAVINTDTDVSEAEPAEVQPVTIAPEIDAPIVYVANIAGLDAQEAQSKYDELKSWVSAHKMEVGIGGLLLLLIVWLIVRVKNRPYQNWDDAVSKDEPEKKGTETTRPSLVDNNDVIDTVEAKPPVAEPEKSIEQLINDADVYVSYGDFSKAKLALQEASRKAPENTSITHKLLFVLFKQSQVKEFVALATEYRNQSEATEWDEVLSWGQELAPNEELFQPQLKSNTASVAQSEVEQPAAIETINIDSDFGNEALNLDIEPNNNVEDIAVSNNGVERLDLPEMEPESLTSDNEEPVSELDNNVMEFDLNIDSESDDNFELDGLDTITDSDLSEATAALSETSQDNEFEFDLGDFDQVDESETKLDLAAAYIDMGDPEGAKSILEEVLLEGNDEQKSRAQTLMTELN